MATTEDAVRLWISQPLLALRHRWRSEPDTYWEVHFEESVSELSVYDASQDPGSPGPETPNSKRYRMPTLVTPSLRAMSSNGSRTSPETTRPATA